MVTLDREHILALPANLSYRLAVDGDLDQLRDYRLECGWGLERLERFWGSPDRPLCVFSIVDQGGRAKDVGMGGWILELEDDGEAASREYGSVQLCKCTRGHDSQYTPSSRVKSSRR